MNGTDIERLAGAAGLPPGQSVSIAVIGPGREALLHARGQWPDGARVDASDRFYAASLAKQVTGTAVALLARQGLLDPDADVPTRFLPKWTRRPTARQLLHHTGGLPRSGEIEDLVGGQNWTDDFALRALAECEPRAEPDMAYAYSNLGYVVLARLVEQAAGIPLQTFASQRIFVPLGLSGIGFTEGGLPASPQAALLGPNLPLSTGDGGLWTTAEAFVGWLDAQNRDVLGVAALVEQDHTLLSGERVGYGWGIGLRRFGAGDLFIHGGGWAGARASAARCPALGLSVVALAADDRDEPVGRLVNALLDALAD